MKKKSKAKYGRIGWCEVCDMMKKLHCRITDLDLMACMGCYSTYRYHYVKGQKEKHAKLCKDYIERNPEKHRESCRRYYHAVLKHNEEYKKKKKEYARKRSQVNQSKK